MTDVLLERKAEPREMIIREKEMSVARWSVPSISAFALIIGIALLVVGITS